MPFSKSFFIGTATALFALMGAANAFNGQATWYHTGLGNCGARSKDTDYIVALPTGEYAGGKHCYKHIKVTSNGKTIDATVVDSCPSCSQYQIDLSPSAFKALAPLDRGLIPVTWSYV